MSWCTITIDQVRLAPQEKTALQNIQGSTDIGAEILTNVVQEFISAMRSGNYPVVEDGSIPDLVRLHAVNRTRWLCLCEFPALKALQTKEREALNKSAEEVLEKISIRALNVEPPPGAVTTSGNWNSENKIVGRMHPIPRPANQPDNTNPNTGYANPDGPEDQGEDS
jgi:hypothetical protein